MTRLRRINPHTESGAALIVVLWVALLLSTLVAGALAVVRTEIRAAHGRAEAFKARMTARSGLEVAAYVTAAGDARNVRELSQYAPEALNGYRLVYDNAAESEKLDINLANEQILQAFFVFMNREPAQAQQLAARIADWRDADDLVRPNGAEARDYARARNGESIGDRPFRTTKELLKVLDFPADLHACIAPAITVLGSSATPAASLLETLYGGSPFPDVSTRSARLSTSSRATSGGVRFAVAAKVDSRGSRRLELNGLYRLTGNASAPYKQIAIFKDRPMREALPEECDFQ